MTNRSRFRVSLLFSSLITALLMGLFLIVNPAEAAVFTVNTCTEAAFIAEFNNAVANPGLDEIRFGCGGVLNIAAEFVVADDLVIDANGFNVTFDGGSATRFFTLNAGTTLTVNGIAFTNGFTPTDAGVVDNTAGGTLNINNASFSLNRAGNDGGAIVNGGILTINNSTFDQNTATNFGGAIDNFSTLTINNTTFSGNDAFLGGAILSGGSLLISGTTFSGGLANLGGAIYGLGAMTVDNSTCYNNRALNMGGCIYHVGGITTFTHTTIANNVAPGGANALGIPGGSFTLTNSIVTSDCTGTINDGGGNIAFNAAGCPGLNVDPMLRPFGNYGGGTASLPPSAGSPALNSAPDCGSLAVDQFGNPRPQGGVCDIGSVELMINAATGEVIEPAIPSIPRLNEWNAEYQEETRAHAWGIPDDVYGTVHMENGAWQYNPGGVPIELVDYGVLLAVDVWIQQPDGQTQFNFGGYQRLCLQGQGRMIFMDATQSPRTMTEILPVDFEGGYTCGWIPNAGTVILIRLGE
ncbi:MAG: right-handed parallel beta-helix repeat-containing protein [Aggregatilineales bacterium]